MLYSTRPYFSSFVILEQNYDNIATIGSMGLFVAQKIS
jgi:hypothetical protein